MNHLLFLIAFTLPCLAAIPEPPPGHGQIEREVETITEPHPPADDPNREFIGQRTVTGKLVLTASNGFFDSGIRAAGEATVKDAAPDRLIVPDFEYLHHWSKEGSAVRWHLWIETPGELHANFHLVTDKAKARLRCKIAGSVQIVETRIVDDPEKIQSRPLTFRIPTPGWHTFEIELEASPGGEVGQLHRVEVFGPAVKDAAVLRARWRPAACHARFSSSKVDKPILWVMSSRASTKAGTSSYSPITTPFGYYGTSFNSDGTSSGSANFSLWSYPRGKPKPQDTWSHMLAAGSPKADFGSFGHEGSGVKLRGDWQPFTGQKEVTLALRYELANPWMRWFGYYLDPETQRFRLFAVAAKWVGDSQKTPGLNPGSFVEQPGPPDRRRCGDLLRDIHRKGWFLDENKNWHPADTMSSGSDKAIVSKHWTSTEDGWFSMGMGGIAHRPGPGKSVQITASKTLPFWLNDRAIQDLHRLPAAIGPRTVKTRGKSAMIEVPLSQLNLTPGEKATLTVYYGTEDCLTFDRDLKYREIETRFWQHSTKPVEVREGKNSIVFKDLSLDTTYHFRVLVESPRGRIWSFETDTFSTQKNP